MLIILGALAYHTPSAGSLFMRALAICKIRCLANPSLSLLYVMTRKFLLTINRSALIFRN